MAMEEQSAPVRGVPAAGVQPRGLVRAGGVVGANVLPAGRRKTAAEKIFEEFPWKPEDALFIPLGCHMRMMD